MSCEDAEARPSGPCEGRLSNEGGDSDTAERQELSGEDCVRSGSDVAAGENKSLVGPSRRGGKEGSVGEQRDRRLRWRGVGMVMGGAGASDTFGERAMLDGWGWWWTVAARGPACGHCISTRCVCVCWSRQKAAAAGGCTRAFFGCGFGCRRVFSCSGIQNEICFGISQQQQSQARLAASASNLFTAHAALSPSPAAAALECDPTAGSGRSRPLTDVRHQS